VFDKKMAVNQRNIQQCSQGRNLKIKDEAKASTLKAKASTLKAKAYSQSRN